MCDALGTPPNAETQATLLEAKVTRRLPLGTRPFRYNVCLCRPQTVVSMNLPPGRRDLPNNTEKALDGCGSVYLVAGYPDWSRALRSGPGGDGGGRWQHLGCGEQVLGGRPPPGHPLSPLSGRPLPWPSPDPPPNLVLSRAQPPVFGGHVVHCTGAATGPDRPRCGPGTCQEPSHEALGPPAGPDPVGGAHAALPHGPGTPRGDGVKPTDLSLSSLKIKTKTNGKSFCSEIITNHVQL